MKQISFLIATILLVSSTYAQEDRRPKRMTLKLTVTDSIQRVDYGYLASLADSGIVMLKSPVVFDHTIANPNSNIISYQNISQVTIKRKGGVGRGILIGGLSGLALGGIIGYISYKPTNCEGAIICFDFGPGADAAAGASLGIVAGAAIGGIIGALAKKTWTIGGKKARFDNMKLSVMDMTYGKKQN
jgi:hypothetical protein